MTQLITLKVVYIFGAGASASIDERVPVMANFFEKAIDMLDENNKSFQLAFAVAEKARALPPNPEVENLGIQMDVLFRLLERANNREELTDAICAYKTTFKGAPNRIGANLEDVFSKVELFKEKSSDADNTYDRLQYMINGLFNKLDKDLQDKFSVAAHHDLSQFVANTEDIKHTFISFNYDLWLERALFQKEACIQWTDMEVIVLNTIPSLQRLFGLKVALLLKGFLRQRNLLGNIKRAESKCLSLMVHCLGDLVRSMRMSS